MRAGAFVILNDLDIYKSLYAEADARGQIGWLRTAKHFSDTFLLGQFADPMASDEGEGGLSAQLDAIVAKFID